MQSCILYTQIPHHATRCVHVCVCACVNVALLFNVGHYIFVEGKFNSKYSTDQRKMIQWMYRCVHIYMLEIHTHEKFAVSVYECANARFSHFNFFSVCCICKRILLIIKVHSVNDGRRFIKSHNLASSRFLFVLSHSHSPDLSPYLSLCFSISTIHSRQCQYSFIPLL